MRVRSSGTYTCCGWRTPGGMPSSGPVLAAAMCSTPASGWGGSTSSVQAERTAPLFERSSDDRVLAGVCGGIAARLAVDATLIRLIFAILALAGGAGILVYFALWIYARSRRTLPAAALFAVASAATLFALGLSGTTLLGATLLVAGLATVIAGGGSLRPGGSLPRLGLVLLIFGAVILLGRHGARGAFLAPGAEAGALLLVVGPWLWQLAVEHAERVRLQERAEVAARNHDSVLRTLALF